MILVFYKKSRNNISMLMIPVLTTNDQNKTD